MKSSCLTAVLVWSVSAAFAQVPSPGNGASDYTVVKRGANEQMWEKVTYENSPTGQQVPRVHRYTEVASGLNHLVSGQWQPSSDQIEILPGG